MALSWYRKPDMIWNSLAFGLMLLALGACDARAQRSNQLSSEPEPVATCEVFAPSPTKIRGKSVGVEQCHIISEAVVFNIAGHRFHRVEMRISGTEDGWSVKQREPFHNNITDGPEFLFVQLGVKGDPQPAIGRYDGSKGAGVSIFYPDDPANWNGKLFVTAHGAAAYAEVGRLIPRDSNKKFNPLTNANLFVGLMMDKGYAVAHTKRLATLRPSQRHVEISFEDGSTITDGTIGIHGGILLTWTALAEKFLAQKLGSAPKRTYFYGMSSGGMAGRIINYKPGLNRRADGSPIFDGFIQDDSGGGLWLPKVVVNGEDILFTTADSRRQFVKQIDITHQAYGPQVRSGLIIRTLWNKRENTRLLKQKGLGDKHRMYEIRGLSHFDAGTVSRFGQRGPDAVFQNLDQGVVMDALIDRLDDWVENGKAPPPTKSDDVSLGDLDGDGSVEHSAIALPEIACSLGVYYAYPTDLPGSSLLAGQSTAFAAFDGANLEPLDARGELVDMNGNGKRDRRETVTEAWRRLGLLQRRQRFDRESYVGCVTQVVSELVDEGLLSQNVGRYYVERAATKSFRY